MAVTDAPVDEAAGVFLTVKSVSLLGADGTVAHGPFAVPSGSQLVNLMDYTGTASATLLSGVKVPAGVYKLRLNPDLAFDSNEQHSWVAFDAASPKCQSLPAGAVWSPDELTCRYPLGIPSGEQSGFKPKDDITVTAGGSTAYTVEFDLRKNLVDPQDASIEYKLKPTGLRLVDNAVVGFITGTINPSLLGAGCPAEMATVYLFDRTGQMAPFTPDDMYPENTALVTSASVTASTVNQQTTYRYLIGFVPVGTYGVALTCGADDPAVNESIVFAAQADGLSVAAGAETVGNLL